MPEGDAEGPAGAAVSEREQAPAQAGVHAAGEGAPGAGRVPEFFIIGHEKCGTTALYKMLRRHPQVFMPDYKEPRFFSSDIRARSPKPGGPKPQTLEAYMTLFAGARPDQLAGEASPQYIRSPGAAARIAQVRPDARIIAILREPASFLRSYHQQCVQSALESERDLRTALALEPERRQGRHLPPGSESPAWLLYSEHVRYVEQLRRYHAVFPPEHVLALIYDDYRRDNIETLRRVLRFLEVDDTLGLEPIETKRETHTAVRFMPLHRVSRKLRMAKHKPESAGTVARTVSRITPRSAQMAWRRLVYSRPAPADAELMSELRRRFKPEVVALSEYLGRDLVALWGYEDM